MKVRADDEDLEHLYKLQLDQGNINVTKVVWIWQYVFQLQRVGGNVRFGVGYRHCSDVDLVMGLLHCAELSRVKFFSPRYNMRR